MSATYEPGTRCWFPDKQLGFIAAEVTANEKLSNGKIKLCLSFENGNDPKELILSSLDEDKEKNLPHLRNPPILEAAEDLTSLSYLNEPAVLHAIKVRYSQLNIYTYSGIVLIAANPFQRIDQLYSPDIIQAYAGKNRGELDPHLFAIAEDAYRCMKRDHKNQTIVVSGESGAGKTVSAKFIMRYFASVETTDDSTPNVMSSTHDHTDMSEVEKQILATNPIMESFGNAKTTRNDNSSRFGKYLEILFDKNTSIIGARIRTYLLERSRLVFQPTSERNYHIFYQMLEGLSEEEKSELSLTCVEDYHYLNQGGDAKITNVDDKKEFMDTSNALTLIGTGPEVQKEIWKILAALLHIGNIQITATRNDAHLSSDETNLVLACRLLGLDPTEFSKWCVKKQIVTRSEKITTNLSHAQSLVARDSVAKFIYAYMFDWLVSFVNHDLCAPDILKNVSNFIGVLDIYGFEHFKVNSFEQFCINYANEKLQQEFNQHVFKLEQEEYIREKIEWSFIEFSDNRPCINLIEARLGILSLLDEESRLPAGSDESWIQKMYTQLDKAPTNSVFKKPRFGGNKFVVSHYAIDVEYDAEGFIEKNRDTVGDGHLETLKNTTNERLKDIIETVERQNEEVQKQKEAEAAANKPKPKFGGTGRVGGFGGKASNRKPTLGSIFKKSLIDLMATINSTNVHYIRCIKPNEQKKAWEFDSLMVLSQLRACGVLETIRISCAGFPTRWTYEEFAQRYHILVHSDNYVDVLNGTKATSEDVRALCDKILQATVEDKQKYQMGETKIFFKAGMLGYLEKLRTNRLHNAAVLIQKNVKANYYRKQYLEIRESIVRFQSLLKGYSRRKRIREEIEEHSAIKLQTLFRGFLVRRRVHLAKTTIIGIQSAYRARKAKAASFELRQTQAALTIQNAWRSYAGKKEFRTYVKTAVYVQSCLRRKLAVRELQRLKEDVKSVNHLQEVSYRLENKVIELTQSLTAKINDNKKLTQEIEGLQKKLQDNSSSRAMMASQEKEFNEMLSSTKTEYTSQIDSLNSELAQTKLDFKESEGKLQRLMKEQAELKETVDLNIEELNQARDQLAKYDNNEQDLKKTITQLKQEIIALTGQGIGQQAISDHLRGGAGFGKQAYYNNPKNRQSWGGSKGASANDAAARAVSVMPMGNREDDEVNNLAGINEELWKLLQDSKALHKEIIESLLKGLKIPPAGVAADLTRKEVLFPARIIIIILSDMWRLGLTKESEDFLGEVLSVIQTIVTGLKDEDVISHGAFWLSNTHELYSFVSYAQSTIIANDSISNELSEPEYDEYLNLVAVVKEDFESLSYNIYNLWMKKMEKDLEKKAVSAVVLSQSLPGFMAQESSPFLAKVFSQAAQYKMDDIISFFNNVYWSMKTYFIEAEVQNEVITELLRFVDANCFNDLIMRRNFLSWKRGLQLNYNVTRLEEWCKSHDIIEGSSYLVHLLQAAKLLQLRKNTNEDIEIIYEICYALKPSQIQKLISQYYVADYEAPIAPEVLQAVADKVKRNSSGASDDFFEPVNNDSGQFDDPFRRVPLRPFVRLEAYVPAWLNLPIIRRIIELVAKNAAGQDSYLIDEQGYGEEEYYMPEDEGLEDYSQIEV
ncbi:myosin 2 [Saccharomycopsis crataegensis]|uniref:Myosin 2 n=1 Tax=Saccharomycopsis crataegensis TaxID=43959 RepID=A0AAV5QMN5_9ASCO|nr:myosin 2 [Saccharomycopsis crataegensis]